MKSSHCLWMLVSQLVAVSLVDALLDRKSLCTPSPCTNNGVCDVDSKLNSTKCYCPDGFSGNRCEKINPCAGDKCQNGGTCVPDVTATAVGYKCLCFPGFTGRNCEQDIPQCDKKPCVHGQCKDLGTTYVCDCQPGYEGVHCDKAASMCSKSPCSQVDAKAKCTVEEESYSCQCSSYDYFGLNCERSSWQCRQQVESYCLCMVNSVPTKFSIPTPKPYVGAVTRDVIAGVVGILLGWAIGTVLFVLYHCCCSSGDKSRGKGRGKRLDRPKSDSSMKTVSSGLSSRPWSINQVHPTVTKTEARSVNVYRAAFVDDMTHAVSTRKSQMTYQSGSMDW